MHMTEATAEGDEVSESEILEFVVFDRSGREIDWVDPYLKHRWVGPNRFVVSNGQYDYPVRVPEGGRIEVRPRRQR